LNSCNFSEDFKSLADVGKSIYSGNGLTVEMFHLKKDTSVMNSFDNANLINGNHTVVYLIINGKIEIRIKDKLIVVEEGNSYKLNFDENYTCWALEDTNMFCIHNCVEPEVDNTPLDLVDAVKKVELDDAYLQGHNYRVGKYSTLIMQTMCPERSTTKYHFAAAYHDVGKVGVPAEVLNKEGKLTKEEFELIKMHPAISYEMLLEFLGKENAEYARWHHEKLDGSGHPDGISGDMIPLESRIMAVVDIFDALTTDRCYRSGFSFNKALEILDEDAGAGKIDAEVVSVLKRMINKGIIVEGVDNMYKDVNSIVHYDGFTLADIRNALATSATGMWKLESEDGVPIRFYGDEIMNDLIGVSDDTSPEERYKIFMSRINPEDMGVFMSYYENLRKEKSEIIYRYDHPEYGTIYVRCGGKLDESVTGIRCYRGFHQNINSTVRVEQEKRRLVTENAELYQKMSSKLMESMTSSAMYIDLQEKTYKWLYCAEKRLDGIERYGDMGRKFSSCMPEEYGKMFLANASMDNLREVFKTQSEYSFSVFVYDETGDLRRITMWYSPVDETHRYILAISRDTAEDHKREQELTKALLAAEKNK